MAGRWKIGQKNNAKTGTDGEVRLGNLDGRREVISKLGKDRKLLTLYNNRTIGLSLFSRERAKKTTPGLRLRRTATAPVYPTACSGILRFIRRGKWRCQRLTPDIRGAVWTHGTQRHSAVALEIDLLIFDADDVITCSWQWRNFA